jgi:hypothetical protein
VIPTTDTIVVFVRRPKACHQLPTGFFFNAGAIGTDIEGLTVATVAALEPLLEDVAPSLLIASELSTRERESSTMVKNSVF